MHFIHANFFNLNGRQKIKAIKGDTCCSYIRPPGGSPPPPGILGYMITSKHASKLKKITDTETFQEIYFCVFDDKSAPLSFCIFLNYHLYNICHIMVSIFTASFSLYHMEIKAVFYNFKQLEVHYLKIAQDVSHRSWQSWNLVGTHYELFRRQNTFLGGTSWNKLS